MSYAQDLASRYNAAHKRLMGLPSPRQRYTPTPPIVKPPPPRIRSTLSPETPKIVLKPTLKQLLDWIAKHEGVGCGDIVGPRRNKLVVTPRKIFYYLAYIYSDQSFTKISNYCNRDHTTVIDGFHRLCAEIKTNSGLRSHIAQYTDQLDLLVQGECKICPFCGK
jgi:hypothetical protein